VIVVSLPSTSDAVTTAAAPAPRTVAARSAATVVPGRERLGVCEEDCGRGCGGKGDDCGGGEYGGGACGGGVALWLGCHGLCGGNGAFSGWEDWGMVSSFIALFSGSVARQFSSRR
jgi:hypothetical protein